ncbi:MAG TPA: alpha/beta fold hydrolase [Candidatus Angelobacter sp.]|nr:alpha/beta fold hydrolase [Candidatus Angelobacter sp.]
MATAPGVKPMSQFTARKALVFCGILSSVLYAAMIWAIRYQGYNLISQVPSELTAIGAPTQALWARLGWIYTGLVIAFGFGVWKSAGTNRVLRFVGGIILAYASLGFLWPFAEMHQREVLAAGGGTLSDTMHVVLGGVTVFLMFLAIAFGATAFGKRFRLYSIATIAVLLAFGALTFLEAPRLQTDLPTPWIGLWERINISVFLLWVAVLATVLLRPERGTRQVMSHPFPFKTPEGQARFLAAYDAAVKLWPVPYEEIDISTRFGTTHVVVCGPRAAPPLVLLHGYMATLTMWLPNIGAFSKEYRVYAVDVMGQPSKSRPDEPICNAADFVSWLTATLDALRLDRVFLVGMSFGGWLALNYAVAVPHRVRRLVLLSPGGLLPMVRQFNMRGMLMVSFPTRLTVDSFFRWLGFTDCAYSNMLDLMYLGLKHFRMPIETARVLPSVVSDEALRTMKVPTLLLIGEHEVISDPAEALERARRLIPDFEGELVAGCRHDMCSSQHQIVDARVLDFLEKARTHDRAAGSERSVA